jgi:hypothetical protein
MEGTWTRGWPFFRASGPVFYETPLSNKVRNSGRNSKKKGKNAIRFFAPTAAIIPGRRPAKRHF